MNARRNLLRAATVPALSMAGMGTPAGSRAAPESRRDADPFSFALIGDIPYGAQAEHSLLSIFADFDADLSFAIHVGDLKSGLEPCSDELLGARAALLRESPVPLVYTPGDNEWTDCHRGLAGGHDPLERLGRLRELFFSRAAPASQPGLGSRLSGLTRQSDDSPAHPFPENLRWSHSGVTFVTINLPGSGNATDGPNPPLAHNRARAAANEAWLRSAFRRASASPFPLLAIATQADPGFGRDSGVALQRSPDGADDPYAEVRALLRGLCESFAGKVLFLHGDSHRFRFDRPLMDSRGQRIERFTRVECFGPPWDSAWVRIGVNPAAVDPWTVAVRHTAPARR